LGTWSSGKGAAWRGAVEEQEEKGLGAYIPRMIHTQLIICKEKGLTIDFSRWEIKKDVDAMLCRKMTPIHAMLIMRGYHPTPHKQKQRITQTNKPRNT